MRGVPLMALRADQLPSTIVWPMITGAGTCPQPTRWIRCLRRIGNHLSMRAHGLECAQTLTVVRLCQREPLEKGVFKSGRARSTARWAGHRSTEMERDGGDRYGPEHHL